MYDNTGEGYTESEKKTDAGIAGSDGSLHISAVGKGRVGEEYHIFLLGWKEDRIHDYCSEQAVHWG